MYYEDITNLLNKYSSKQPGERWSPTTEKRKNKIVERNRKLRLFDAINSEYWQLKGTQIDRAKYLIKQLNFNDICPRCSSEQIIVMICYFVKCEYNPRYSSNWCKRVFEEYNISNFLIERFLIYLVEYEINQRKFL